MKKRVIRAFGIALALTLLCSAAMAEVRTTGNVWLRSGPGLSYDQVTSFAKNKVLKYLGETQVDERGVAWYKVSSGKNTGWISSRYSVLEGEESIVVATEAPTVEPTAAPTEAPTAAPTVEPTAEPTAEATEAPLPRFDEPEEEAETAAPISLPALDAGLLFSSSVNEEQEGEQLEPAVPEQAVELSQYYREELVVAANDIGLISYRQVVSEAPYQYYDDSVIVAGNQYVENIVVYGDGYEVFGVRVGMSANAAMACLNAAGLEYVSSTDGITYLHPAAEDSQFYVNEDGFDSNINLWVDDDNIVTEIDWSTFTG